MKSKENLIFLGMMGSGKSSIGFLIAKKLKLTFVDTDKEIENLTGLTISKIFETKGENYFRDIEEKTTLKNLKLKSAVVSLGGGAFLNKNIREKILKNHLSIWLNCNYKTLIKRIRNSNKRPLADSLADSEIIDLTRKRSKIYSKALYEIKCDNLTKNQIIDRILKIYETNKIKS
tara:strand:+ start:27 stop:551 length:525 start_codon:yes stop_codon:yes gene_type:complete